MSKIKVKSPLVEIDGDEMTRIMWRMVKERLLFPFLDLDLKYYDLHLSKRDETDDHITIEAANAIKKYRVGVKCATITPNKERVKEYKLKRMWPSPNGTIRALLDGTVFRSPIMVKNVKPIVKSWVKPITIGRHAYGDVYKSVELAIPGPGKAEIVFTPADGGEPVQMTVQEFDGPGVLQGIHNLDSSIHSFARACFTFAYDQKIDLWFSAKDTISETYDARFREIFNQEFEQSWKDKFDAANLKYFFTLIDDAVARVMKDEGGFLWACKNYDGDVMSDMVASAFGSLAMMTSVLVSPHGYFEYEAAHGTVQRHYYKYLAGEETSTNPTAIIFAWSGSLKKRGELDGTPEVIEFAEKLEKSTIETIESGIMTGDLALIAEPKPKNPVRTEAFIEAIASRLQQKMGR
ncbi:MAG: NADP-dependent isocitrate dehydrogenase [Dethiobacteria bacterium]|jgi:isocitrate dehydrogenase